jgi:hypothetical protein
VANDPQYISDLRRLREEMDHWLTETNDPRILGGGERFEGYPYYLRIKFKGQTPSPSTRQQSR